VATVAINTTGLRTIRSFDRESVGNNPASIMPFAEVVFSNPGVAIALLGAGDVNVWTYTCTLPANFVYRVVEMKVLAAGPAESDLDDAEPGMMVTATENQVAFKNWLLWNQCQYLGSTSGSLSAIAAANPATTNDFQTIFANPAGADVQSDFIDASQGISIIQTVWVNFNATSSAMTVSPYYRFYQYTIDQFTRGAIWTPSLVVT